MSDEVDRAQAREEEQRQDALARHARRADGQARRCAVCGEDIHELRRRLVPGVQTCIECQRDLERGVSWN